MKPLSASLLAASLAFWVGPTSAQTVDPDFWVTNGEVTTVVVDGNTIYIGGRFTMVGPVTGGGVARNHIAALDATTGQATAWNPNANGFVNSLEVNGGVVYAGGTFTSIGGQARSCLAALDGTTGSATSWDPDVEGGAPGVGALAIGGGTVYVSGDFRSIGGQERHGLAALDIVTGVATAWNPTPLGVIHALAVGDGVIYVGGQFHRVAGEGRDNIAAIDASTGSVTAWAPQVTGSEFGVVPQIRSLAVSGDVVYVGGEFDNIGGQVRHGLAALDVATGTATSWNPALEVRAFIVSVVPSGATVYVGGAFHSIGGQPRHYFAALDEATGVATAWNPIASAVVRDVAVTTGTVYAAGGFTWIGGQEHPYFAALTAAADREVCVHDHGFWKKDSEAWPTSNIRLGVYSRSPTELLALLQGPVRGDASVLLAKQLIAAKLNVENGVDASPVSSAIFTADSLIGDAALPMGIRPSSTAGKIAVAVAERLENFNTGEFTPACSGPDKGRDRTILSTNGRYGITTSEDRSNPLKMADGGQIDFTLRDAMAVQVTIYTVLGRRVRTLVSGTLSAGTHSTTWDGRDENGNSVSTGIYFCRFTAGGESSIMRMLNVQ